MFLLKLIDALNARAVRYALAGGYAVALHGAVRGTVDVDLVLPCTESSYRKAESAMLALGLKSRLPVTASEVFLFRKEYIQRRNVIAWSFSNPDSPSEIVDIIITVDLRKCRTQKIEFMGRKINVLSLPDLIRMKQKSNRLQDQADVEALKTIRKQKGMKS